ncbi:hypothetical protein GCM10011487_68910 [Steroidobacter agaridevorans]|uniref:Rad50/SbcC-type AAA domain-containing protein n=1 Tax=Steroidobacter agaridevorans TaxID=2695856 RepID=A0A829YPH0_9GAMM|nr:hypothetical protein GCM10011487_68910 [Steroidobacter agaridevorans]
MTVLYGPNGFGKTSLFDALDFAVTGGIGRLKAISTDQLLAKAAKHLDSGDEESEVSLTFTQDDKTHTVTRTLSKPAHATLDSNKGTSRKDVLAKLTGYGSAVADRVDNLVSLFRATHLFSQESQELTKDFQDKCELSAELVSRMLAFDDYVSGLNKTSEIQRLIKVSIDAASKDVARLSASVEVARREVDRLDNASARSANPDEILTELSALKADLANFGIQALDDQPNIATLRGWRSQLESRAAETEILGERLSKAVADLQQLRDLERERALLQSSQTLLERSLADITSSQAVTATARNIASNNFARMKGAEADGERLVRKLMSVAASKPEYDRLVRTREELAANLEIALRHRERLRNEESSTASTLQLAETAAHDLSTEIANKARHLEAIQALARDWTAIDVATIRLRNLAETEEALIEDIVRLRAAANTANTTLAEKQAEIYAIEREVEAREAESSEVKSLLAQLRSHTKDGTCILCGIEHESKEKLLARIDARLTEEGPLNRAREQLTHIRAEAAEIQDQATTSKVLLDDALRRNNDLRSEKAELEKLLLDFSSRAASLGVPSALDQLELSVRQAEQALVARRLEHEKAKQALGLATLSSNTTKVSISANANEIETIQTGIDEANGTLKIIEDKASAENLQLSGDPANLQAAIASAVENLELARTATQNAQKEVDQRTAEADQQLQSATSYRNSLDSNRRRAGTVARNISDLTSSLAQLGIAPDLPDQSILNLITANSDRRAQLQAARERAAILEVAMDAATTSAALQGLHTTIKQNLELISTANEQLNQLVPWAKYFERIANLLHRQRSSATESFTRDYGPRTAVIQRRLRPVYGFGDIEISSRGGAINVGVVRNGEALRPIDYFSQSQIQTLLLGLFLTASSSQTWSSFSSVMMDDPVTHFDDLNTYSLLDLISGLLQSPDGVRQFVISTCDEKLLQLARQKFRHLGDGAKFYHFSAIGAEGPVIEELSA